MQSHWNRAFVSVSSAGCAAEGGAASPPPTIIPGRYTAESPPDGNSIIFERRDGLIVNTTLLAGGLVVVPAPFFDTACPEGWQRALADLASTPFKTLVPGHGAAMTRADFDLYRSAFDALVGSARNRRQSALYRWLAAQRRALPRYRRLPNNALVLLDDLTDEIIRNEEKRVEPRGY